MWYQCQERAMAPGIGGEESAWPVVIRPQHSIHARLKRMSGDPIEWLKLLADCDSELSAIAAGRPPDKAECLRLSGLARVQQAYRD